MKIKQIENRERAIRVHWSDGSSAEFPFIWLRDNDPAELHPHTRERTFDLTCVPLEIVPTDTALNDAGLLVRWPQRDDVSVYTVDWLRRHAPGSSRPDPAAVTRSLWSRDTLAGIPRADAVACGESRTVLRDTLLTAKTVGLVLIGGLSDQPGAGRAFGERVGFLRETNFGDTFEVINKPDPNNLAYTALALPLHTDLPNQESVPGYQFLHSYRNSATGGESVFADGFRICADLKREEPGYYDLLSQVPVAWRFHDDTCDIRRHRPIIGLDHTGQLVKFVFNAHVADIPDLPASELGDFYAAYRALMQRIRQPGYAIRHRLAPGEMVMFDNHRVLHSRTAFDPASGERYYLGYYIEHNEVDSRIRVLSRPPTTEGD